MARSNGTTVAELQKANGMKSTGSRINIGQTIKIPGKAAAKKDTGKSKGSGTSSTRKGSRKKSGKKSRR